MLSKKDARHESILAIARTHFFRTGYAGTSMSAIATDLGGSKTTLWNHFPSKQALFMAVADQLIMQYVDAVTKALRPEDDIDATLRKFGRLLIAALLSEPVVALARLVTGESDRFPELGKSFHERGLGYGWSIMQGFIDEAIRNGKLRASDSLYAAKHFIGLCQSGVYQERMMGNAQQISRQAIAADVDAAVDAFLKAYRAS